jgi:hypothetical protein
MYRRPSYHCYNTTLTRKVLPPFTENILCRWYIFHHTTHSHLTDDRLENTSAANALMLMSDKVNSPDCVGHDPFLVSRPEGSTRNMQSPKTKMPSSPQRYRGLYLDEVSEKTQGLRQGLREPSPVLLAWMRP